MSAVFEVSLLYKKRVSLCEVINNINSTRFSCDIEKIEVIDNWQYENERIIRKNEFNQIQKLISEGKIVIIEGKINSIHQFGISFSVTDQDNFDIEFWISTKEINELDSSYITNTNLYIYDLLLKKLTQFLNKKYLIFCSIGSETVLSCNEIDEVDISKSKNVCMWIFPTDKNIQALERYSKNTVNDLIVYRLYE